MGYIKSASNNTKQALNTDKGQIQMKIYLATPIESASRPKEEMLAYAEQVAKLVEAEGNTVHRPWKVHIPNAWDMSNQDWGKAVAESDIEAIDSCDAVIGIIYDRREATAGTMWELGYAYAMRIPTTVVIHESAKQISLMVASFADHIYCGIDNFNKYVEGCNLEVC